MVNFNIDPGSGMVTVEHNLFIREYAIDYQGWLIPKPISAGALIKRKRYSSPAAMLEVSEQRVCREKTSIENEKEVIVKFVDTVGITILPPGRSRGAYNLLNPCEEVDQYLHQDYRVKLFDLKGGVRFMAEDVYQCPLCKLFTVSEKTCNRCGHEKGKRPKVSDIQEWKARLEERDKEEEENTERQKDMAQPKRRQTMSKTSNGGKREKFMDHSLRRILYWFGAKGYSVADATVVFKLKNLQAAPSTISTLVKTKNPSGTPAKLTKKQEKELRDLITSARKKFPGIIKEAEKKKKAPAKKTAAKKIKKVAGKKVATKIKKVAGKKVATKKVHKIKK